MPRFAANLSMLYPEHEFLDRFAAAAADGFEAVEFLFPYDHPAASCASGSTTTVCSRSSSTRCREISRSGDRGLACLPGRQAEFLAGVDRAIEYAQVLGCPRLHAMAGLMPADAKEAVLRATYVANLAEAAARCRSAGLDLLIEPINTRDIPGYYLNTAGCERTRWSSEVGAANLKVQMDLYHCQIVEGDLAMRIRQAPAGRRSYPDRRRAGAARTGHRRDQLSRTCSRCSTSSVTTAGSAASTGPAAAARRVRRRPASAGCGPGWRRARRRMARVMPVTTAAQVAAAARQRQGPRQLCGRRGPPADGHQRPAVGFRRGDDRADTRQGQGAQHAGAVLVRPVVGRRAESPDRHCTGNGGCGRRGRTGPRSLDGRATPAADAGRGGGTGLPRRIGLQGIPGTWQRLRHRPAARPAAGAEASRADLHAGGQGCDRRARREHQLRPDGRRRPARRSRGRSAKSVLHSTAGRATTQPAAASSSRTPSSSSVWTRRANSI